MVVKKCEVFPIEFVVRGYITGTTKTSLWTHYSNGERDYCGIQFPDGLKKNQRLVQPVITPTTKGETDEPISLDEIVSRGIMKHSDLMYCVQKAMELYKYGTQIARGSGLILVDTKYEFGVDPTTGKVMLVDEIHTCDSSRYWKADTYDARFQSSLEPENFDKDLVRSYVKSQCDPYTTKPSEVTIPSHIKDTVRKVYLEFYITLTGETYIETPTTIRDTSIIRDPYFRRFLRDRVYIIYSDQRIAKLKNELDLKDVYFQSFKCNPYTETRKLLEYLDEINQTHLDSRVIIIAIDEVLGKIIAGNTAQAIILNCNCINEDSNDESHTVDLVKSIFRM
jgi:phosphoribosylaminoimidazole-succinocarboxamide synthase